MITDNIINIMINLFKCLGTPKKTITSKHERWNKEQNRSNVSSQQNGLRCAVSNVSQITIKQQ
jgi:hypothetical protein